MTFNHIPSDLKAADLAKGKKLFSKNIKFILSAPKEEFLPPPTLPEIAFAGRSNVGKSSLLNAVTNHMKMARTSNTPGRTQELNYFDINQQLYLVDTPGYGYARASKTKVSQWQQLIKDYLAYRVPLKRVYLLIDARHGLKKNDIEIMDILDKAAASYHIILTKIDKIKENEISPLIISTEKQLKDHPAAYPFVLATSAEKKLGIDALRAFISSFI